MAEQAERTLAQGTEREQAPRPGGAPEQTLEVVADAGYCTEVDIAACEAKPITVYVPIPDKHRTVVAGGRLPGSDFRYDAARDVYICPGKQRLTLG